MNDPKKDLSKEGFSQREVDLILDRAVKLQQSAEEREYMARDTLSEGAESAGIKREFVDEAIQQVRKELKREKAERQKKKRVKLIGGAVLAGLVIMLFFSTNARLNARMSDVEKRRAQLENVLQRRHDLIPNLVNMAKASAGHEKDLIESLTRYQQEIDQTDDFKLKQAWEQKLGAAMKDLMNSAQNNLTGASAQMFTRLSDEMAGAENRIAVERKRYNEAVADYNRTARGFFTSLARPFTGYPAELPYFEASDAAHRRPSY